MNMIELLKKLKRVIFGKDFFYTPTIKVPMQRLGSSYGGWWIATDGLKDTPLTVLSFGLGEDISFDLEVLKNYNAKVYGFDPTPKSIKYVESMHMPDGFELYKYALAEKNGFLSFNLPENKDHVSGSLESIDSDSIIEVECKSLKAICQEFNIGTIDILKMDIEGSEYKVIQDMVDSKIFPQQILVEYHHFFDSFSNNDTKESIKLLLDNGYGLFHIDGYNYSFIRS